MLLSDNRLFTCQIKANYTILELSNIRELALDSIVASSETNLSGFVAVKLQNCSTVGKLHGDMQRPTVVVIITLLNLQWLDESQVRYTSINKYHLCRSYS